MFFRFASLALLAIVGLSSVEAGFRCSIGTAACQASCNVLKFTLKKVGYCDDEGECICDTVDETFFSKLNIKSWVKDTYQGFKDEVNPSRCQVSESFCEKTCQATLHESGSCNEAFTDCTCSDKTLSAKQYALCGVSGDACAVYCQVKDFLTGKCLGDDSLDCKCIDVEDIESEAIIDESPEASNPDDDVEIF